MYQQGLQQNTAYPTQINMQQSQYMQQQQQQLYLSAPQMSTSRSFHGQSTPSQPIVNSNSMDNVYTKTYISRDDSGDFKKPPIPPKPKSNEVGTLYYGEFFIELSLSSC